jgi:hypothetical protein
MAGSALAVLVWSLLLPGSALGQEAKRFCSMDQAVTRLLEASDVSAEAAKNPIIRSMAEDIVAGKLAGRPGASVAITWKDVADLRGTVNVWLCEQGHKLNCAGGAIDAVGSGLMGSRLGRTVMGGGLALAGPPGWVLLSGLPATQETFQCEPSALAMAVETGAGVVVLVPWCRTPGVERACVAVGTGAKKGALAVANLLFGNRVSAQVVRETGRGVEIALVQSRGSASTSRSAGHAVINKIAPGGKASVNFDGGGVVGEAGSLPAARGAAPSASVSAREALRAASTISPKAANAPALFEKALRSTKLGGKVVAEQGVFYRGITPEALRRVAEAGALAPKSMYEGYRGLSFEQALKKFGADGLVAGHTQGATQYFTSLTKDLKIAEIYGTSQGFLLRVSVRSGAKAYPTAGFTNFRAEKEYLVPGTISQDFIEVFDKATARWTPLRAFLSSRP